MASFEWGINDEREGLSRLRENSEHIEPDFLHSRRNWGHRLKTTPSLLINIIRCNEEGICCHVVCDYDRGVKRIPSETI